MGEKQDADPKGSRSMILSVREIKTVKRHGLLPTINSLAVYQYLNRGTFRAISVIAPDSDINHPWLDKNFLENRISYDLAYEGKRRETKFGYFVRRYLDFIFDRSEDQAKRPFWDYLGFNTAERVTEVLLRTLNPAQIETAALLLVLDMGLTPEIAVAKALDQIDIRAKARKPEIQRIFKQVTTKLKALGCTLSDSALKLLNEKGILQIQCKDYDAKLEYTTHGDEVVLLKPFTAKPETNTLTLASLFDKKLDDVHRAELFPHLNTWLTVLAEDLE